MDKSEYFSLISEKNTLVGLIEKTPDTLEYSLQKMSLKSRLNKIECKLKNIGAIEGTQPLR